MPRSARSLLHVLRDPLAFRFLIGGGVNTAIGYGLFATAFRLLGRQPRAAGLAQTLSYAVGVGVAYLVSRFWTFGSLRVGRAAFPRFIAVHLTALAFSSALLQLAVGGAGAPAGLAWVGVTGVTTVLSYLAQRFWVFAERSRPAHRD